MEFEDIIDNISHSEIRKSSIHGFGLFARLEINSNSILGFLDGQLISYDLNKKKELAYEWNAISEKTLLVRPYRTKYSYINHSRDPNLKIYSNPLRVVSNKTIRKGEELTLDYRNEPLPLEYLKNHGKSYL